MDMHGSWMRFGTKGVAAAAMLLCAQAVSAAPLQAMVLRALEIDPAINEANANIAAAESRTESARRQHWPRLGVAASEALTERQRRFFDQDPLRPYASVNLWSGGGIEAQVESGRDGEDYYRNKAAEGREEIAYRVASLYLDGLRAEDELALARTNLLRHESLMRDLGVVAKLDTGRRSDLTQAQSRQGQARARVVTAETALNVLKSRLRRYSADAPVRFEPVEIGAPELDDGLGKIVSQQPEYQAQVAEVSRLEAQVDAAKARRWPKVDFEASYANDGVLPRVLLNWDLVNASALSDVTGAEQQLAGGRARLATIDFDLRERLQAAQISHQQAGRKLEVVESQIVSAQQVVGAFEEQFQIARRSMLDLLNAYSELSGVESSAAAARAERRTLALQYLRATSLTERWARQSLPVGTTQSP